MSFNPDEYWEKRLTTKKGLLGVGYSRLGKYFNFWAYKVRSKVFNKSIKFFASKTQTSTVLDIGSGSGFYIHIWNQLNAKSITGIDITSVAISNLKSIYPNNSFYKIDIGSFDFNKEGNLKTYTLISCLDVLFHIVDDIRFTQAFKNIASLIEKDGYFIYSDNFLHQKEIRTLHQVSRTKVFLENLFIECGFEIIERKPFMYLTNTPIDSNNPFLKVWWFLVEQSVSRIHILGWLIGLIIYPFELILLKYSKEGPSTEIVVARKK